MKQIPVGTIVQIPPGLRGYYGNKAQGLGQVIEESSLGIAVKVRFDNLERWVEIHHLEIIDEK